MKRFTTTSNLKIDSESESELTASDRSRSFELDRDSDLELELELELLSGYHSHHHDGILDYPRYCAMISKALDHPKLSLQT